jgi:peptidoglycan hydrolase-like protein with peptidoglycan-binding domain
MGQKAKEIRRPDAEKKATFQIDDAERAGIIKFLTSKDPKEADVKALQKILKSNGLYGLGVDGDFGKETGKGLLAVLKADPSLINQMSPAIVQTMKKEGYLDDVQKIVKNSPDLYREMVLETTTALKKTPIEKMKGAELAATQGNLALLGFLNDDVDGLNGKRTRRAEDKFEAHIKEEEARLAKAGPRVANLPKPEVVEVKPKAGTKDVLADAKTEKWSYLQGSPIDSILYSNPLGLGRSFFDAGRNMGPSFADQIITEDPMIERAIELGLVKKDSFEDLARMRAAVPVLDMIAKHEAKDNYDIANGSRDKGFTGMTVEQVQAWQKKDQRRNGILTAAAGAFQMMPEFIADKAEKLGLSGKELFDEGTQRLMAYVQLIEHGFDDFLEGKRKGGTVANLIADTWAIFKKSTGVGAHDGVGTNKGVVSANSVVRTLKEAKEIYRETHQELVAAAPVSGAFRNVSAEVPHGQDPVAALMPPLREDIQRDRLKVPEGPRPILM